MVKRFSSTSPTEPSLGSRQRGLLLEVGQVGRPHGLKGDVVVRLVSNVAERLAPGSVLECDGRQLVVAGSRALPGKSGPPLAHWVVHFSGVSTPDEARVLTGRTLRAEATEGAPGLWAHELVGCEVQSSDGQQRGRVLAIEANPASDLLVLDSGALVPLRFVVSAEGGRVLVDVPAGLFDI